MGHVVGEWQNNPYLAGYSKYDAYSYDYLGDIKSFTDVPGPTFAYSGGGGSVPVGRARPATLSECTTMRAQPMSLARIARIQDDNFVGQAILGNAFSGLVDLYDTAKTNVLLAAATLVRDGVPLPGVGGTVGTLSKGLVGNAQDAAIKAGFQNLGKEGAQAAADGIGNVKLVYDGVTFLYAGFQCALHP